MNTDLAGKLATLVQHDTDTRSRLLEAGELYGIYHEDMQRVHRDNARALDEIIAAHGWPGKSLVGVDGARNAWHVAQHAICTPDLQRRFLQHLADAAAIGEAIPGQVAMLTDRIRFHEGRPQVYGLVFDWDDNGELNCALEDAATVDARRAAAGLPSFSDALHKERAAVAAEGGQAPQDMDAYRQSQLEWARRTGWR